jgi:hypothetical protein
MKTAVSSCLAAVASLALACQLAAQSQLQLPAASPSCTLKQRVGLTDIEINYSRPGVKDREVFGGIVPWGHVWRTGANASTKISFSTPVKLNGNTVPAGTYGLFTIPDKEEWTIILSKDAKGFGAFDYKQENDVVRFKTKPIDFPTKAESFTIDINDIRDESALLFLLWDQTLVPVRLEVDVNSKVLPEIEKVMASSDKKSAGVYFQAASYYYEHDQDLTKALAWLNKGLEDKPDIAFELLYMKARILAKQGDKAGAIAAAKESIELAKANEGLSSIVKMDQDIISSLQ